MSPVTPFLAVPAAEIAAFALVAVAVGFWPALLAVLILSAAGALLLRRLGVAALRRGQLQLEQGQFTADEIVQGLWMAAAGVLLVLPGFVSGLAGLALFVPPLRRTLGRWLVGRYRVHAVGDVFARRPRDPIQTNPPIDRERTSEPPTVLHPGPVIDVEFEDIPPGPQPPGAPR